MLSESTWSDIASWNQAAAEVPAANLHRLFEAQVRRTPDAAAVVFEGQALTYAELNRRANRCARRLVARGVSPGDRVGLCLHRSIELIVGVLGTWKAGAAYVPINPSYPEERVRIVIADARPEVLLVHRGAPSGVPAERVLDLAGTFELGGDGDLDVELPATAAAYVIYTSGSTGTPKGVVVEHGAVVNLFAGLRATVYGPRPAPLRLGLNAELTFDASVQQLVQLLDGHTLHIVPDEARADAAAFWELVRRERLDGCDFTPTHLRLLLEHRRLARDAGGELPIILVGGEQIDDALWDKLAALPGAVFNVYGATECTVDTTITRVRGAGAHVGRPMVNCAVYLLGEDLRPVPVGVTGEIFIGGIGPAQGYLSRPEEPTAERFLPDPFAPTGGRRMYRTGDLGLQRPNGDLVFGGRLDGQVKIRGFRVEVGEVESHLAAHPDVSAVAVVASDDHSGFKRLVAYFTARADAAPPSAEVLRRHMRDRVPEYMVPAVFVPLDAFPRASSGKIDRRALPAPAHHEQVDNLAAGDTESRLAEMFKEVLEVSAVGRDDDFFELGGHSLLAVRLLSHIRDAFSCQLPMAALYGAPTVAGLAAALQESASRPRA